MGSATVQSSEFGEIPQSVKILWDLLDGATTDDERSDIYYLLLGECSKSLNDALYLYFLRRSVDELPDDPIIISSAAFSIAIVDPGSRNEALSLARAAVARALVQDSFVRLTAGNQARIALLLDDYPSLNEALSVLVSDANKSRKEDMHYEFDFVDRIDPARCDPDLLHKYKQLASA